jgi:hypothetical protein
MTHILAYLAGALTFGLLTMAVLMRVHRAPPPTLHHRRKNRDAPDRKLFDEIQEGVADPERERNGGVDYKWLGMTGSEQE